MIVIGAVTLVLGLGAPARAQAPGAAPIASETVSANAPTPASTLPASTTPAKEGASEVPATAAKPAAPPPAPNYTLVARVDLTKQRMTVSVDGAVRHTWAISSGKAGFGTPRGTFRVQWMARMWHSRKYDLAPMPHSVFFHGGVAIHGTGVTHLLGHPASHGCVRLAYANAATFYALVKKHGVASTQVIVTGTPPPTRSEDLVADRGRGLPPVRLAPPPRGSYYSRYSYDGSTLRPVPWASPRGYAGRPMVFPGDSYGRGRW
jgi:lipoprotein-anchoring transpeptidase ErfK/SrfK